ncbi:MAG TPA: biosynthetic arginine decarboxylase [Acidobacteria bacterium]|nr:biosynthetic arginine decarboxylase [Acidobacteriota bacterium]
MERHDGGWTPQEAAGLYGIEAWGKGYFRISPRGTVEVLPDQDPGGAVDLLEIVEGLRGRGIDPPVLLRFRGILDHRIRSLAAAFRRAMEENEYRGDYLCAYPIKVNQQRHVVEEIRRFGADLGFGVEVGSKPELLAVLGLPGPGNGGPIICNGFKDSEFIETVVLAAKLGRNIIPVVEKFNELELIVRHAERYGVRPAIGIRVKLATQGDGRWKDSGGLRSKFGLHITELIEAVRFLEERGLKDRLELLHCHVGSQVLSIRSVKNAVAELAQVFAELCRLGAGLRYLDIGGGLGVDYDGSQSGSESSINYTLTEYAGDVVYRVGAVCDEAGLDHPTIVTESGRALVAYHSVLVFDIKAATGFDRFRAPESIEEAAGEHDPEEFSQPLWDLYQADELIREGDVDEALHDAIQAYEEILNLFKLGYLGLEERSLAERVFWRIGREALRRLSPGEEPPAELSGLEALLSDIYFGNLSIFQSMPDSWAIGQLFPILPIHRLDERPGRRAILADMTCDSEGKITRFVTGDGLQSTLPVHALEAGRPYYLGAFLVGAYQEILGDLHNLFGDTHALHIDTDGAGGWTIEELIEGDTVREVLHYVQFDPDALLAAFRRDVERAMREGRLALEEGRQLVRFYQEGLNGYTYLEEG